MAIFSASGLSTAPVTNVLDEGLYLVQLNKVEPMVSKQKGTPGLHMDMTIIEGAVQNGTGSSPIGRKLFYTIWLPTEGAGNTIGLQRLAKLCKVTGVDQTDELELDLFTGKELIVRVKHRMYNGEPQEDLADFKPVPSNG